ncbi:MAG: FixH family protein [Pseudomonadota bacterium]
MESGSFEVKGRHVLIALLMFFGVIITVNVIFVRLALASFPGEEAKKSYLQGLRYTEVLDEREAERELGWRIAVQTDGGEVSRAGPIVLVLTDADGHPLDGLKLDAYVARPTTDRETQDVTFINRSNGVYRGDDLALNPGVWDLFVSVKQDGEVRLRGRTRLEVRPDE